MRQLLPTPLACVLVLVLAAAGSGHAPRAAERVAPARATATVPTTSTTAVGGLEAAARADSDPVLRDVYADRRFVPLWTGDPAAAARRATMLALLARERRLAGDGDAAPADRIVHVFDQGRPAEAELDLTRAALAYLGRRAGGGPVAAATAARLLGQPATSTPADAAIGLRELRIVEALGGWQPVRMLPLPSVVIPPLTPMRPELELVPPVAERPKPRPEVASLRRRLAQSLDLPAALAGNGGAPGEDGGVVDEPLAAAVRTFQLRHGLAADGVVGARTAAALNERASAQIRQVELNAARRQQLAGREALPRYIEVNIPAFELRLVEDGRVAFRSRVIVGDQDTPTPVFDDRMRWIELNPAWNVPRSIVKEIVDKEAAEAGYMAKAGFVWRGGGEGAPSRLVQRPGPENALGRLKFVFPNHHAVYIHDTPNRGLFSRGDRTLSHGCIRLENPAGLALALLGRQGWDTARLNAALRRTGTRRVELDSSVPVFLDYVTAGVDVDGRLQLWPDIYGFDAAGRIRFPTKGLPPEPEPAAAPDPGPTVSAGVTPPPVPAGPSSPAPSAAVPSGATNPPPAPLPPPAASTPSVAPAPAAMNSVSSGSLM